MNWTLAFALLALAESCIIALLVKYLADTFRQIDILMDAIENYSATLCATHCEAESYHDILASNSTGEGNV